MTDHPRRHAAVIRAIALHEWRCATRSRVLLVLVAAMVAVSAGSILIAAYDFKAQVADYNAYLADAAAAGTTVTARPTFFALQLTRAVIEYVEIIGAVLAIGLGYLSIARERSGNTLPLLLSRPVTTTHLVVGRLAGATALITTTLASSAAATIILLGIAGAHWLTPDEVARLVIAFVAALAYMLAFYALGAALTARARTTTNGLVIAIAIWLCVVLIVPQIGDTMDPDNQVPGGLFAALQVEKPAEKQVLAHFSTYEHLRSTLEETSLTKHFERFTFAMTGIKDTYNGVPIATITTAKRADIAGIVIYLAATGALLATALRRKNLTRKADR